jgi:hypothetical protein
MTELTSYQVYATSLHDDIKAAANDGLPRREVLLDWLDDFLTRAKKRGFEMAPADLENLTALDQFVRFNGIPATVRAALA